MNFINYSHYTQPEDLKRLGFVMESIKETGIMNAKVLDIGCGNGNISYQLAKSGYTVTGIDISSEAIEYANKHFTHPNATFTVHSVYDIKTPNAFDVIICSEVLEHLPVPGNMLATMKKLLTPQGICIITVPNGKGPREVLVTKPVQKIKNSKGISFKIMMGIKKLLGYKQTTIQSSAIYLDHIQFFSLSDLKKLYSENGFEMVKIQGGNFLEKAFPVSIVARFIRPLQKLDCWLADKIPINWVSGFFTVVKPINKS
ncbi:MAG: methyltransferase domain-containing protein [Bacteroidales bacterium]|nr:methyltransferase domain-containing protein [Bacteroidales bacterium]